MLHTSTISLQEPDLWPSLLAVYRLGGERALVAMVRIALGKPLVNG